MKDMFQLNFKLKSETKTCFRFETGEKPNFVTLYLKKTQVRDAGIDPQKGVTVTIEEGNTNV